MWKPSGQRVLEEGALHWASAHAVPLQSFAASLAAAWGVTLHVPTCLQLCSEHGISKDGMLEEFATLVRGDTVHIVVTAVSVMHCTFVIAQHMHEGYCQLSVINTCVWQLPVCHRHSFAI